MRFVEDGPDIPDELLHARDAGRVVVFCGAGVSRALAGLPDFLTLAERVVDRLNASEDDDARKLLTWIRESNEAARIGGAIPIDRVFGLLEQSFGSRDIESAIAREVEPSEGVELAAHRVLLDLATTEDGTVQLVTTNFDRLFDRCRPGVKSWCGPNLPVISGASRLDGMIYLHGRVTPDYDGSEGEGFVISSSSFGRAYLSNGWATSFIRQLLDQYVVLFVGYGADDAPVQYLLEALHREPGGGTDIYAFQPGEGTEATARWYHRGVQPIPYRLEKDHDRLWESLDSWASRARGRSAWYDDVIERARSGPRGLTAVERGQVAHVVSTFEGARKFASADPPLSAEWLCVFDPERRYGEPGSEFGQSDTQARVDPFACYSLDSDQLVRPSKPGAGTGARQVPPGAWSAFTQTESDIREVVREDHGTPSPFFSSTDDRLSMRLRMLARWLSTVSGQPAAIWWAVQRPSLARSICREIRWAIDRESEAIGPRARAVWRYLLDQWESSTHDLDLRWHDFRQEVASEGWNSRSLRLFSCISEPCISVQRGFSLGVVPPTGPVEDRDILGLAWIQISYPRLESLQNLPARLLPKAAEMLRRRLELAVELEYEIGGHGLHGLPPIIPDEELSAQNFSRFDGLGGSLVVFSHVFERLASIDRRAAELEAGFWPTDEEHIFQRLRIWAGGWLGLATAEQFDQEVARLAPEWFWGARHSRDLMLSISKAWSVLSPSHRRKIEERCVDGPPQSDFEDYEAYQDRSTHQALARLVFLRERGCQLSAVASSKMAELEQRVAPGSVGRGESAVESMEPRTGWVSRNYDHSELVGLEPRDVIAKARQLVAAEADFLVERRPFEGLSEADPQAALGALVSHTGDDEFPNTEWVTFLAGRSRWENHSIVSDVGSHLLHLDEEDLRQILPAVAAWLAHAGKWLADANSSSFYDLVDRVLELLGTNPDLGRSALRRTSAPPDWITEAINSPAGHLAQALLLVPITTDADGSLSPDWLSRVTALLSLGGDQERYALALFGSQINLLFGLDADWVISTLLARVESVEPEAVDAFWSGVIVGNGIRHRKLFGRLKEQVLAIAARGVGQSAEANSVVAADLLREWATRAEESGERQVTDKELRNLLRVSGDVFRMQVLSVAQGWAERDQPIENGGTWFDEMLYLLRAVWPRDLSVKTADTSAALCSLALDSKARFVQVVSEVLPLVAPSNAVGMKLYQLPDVGVELARAHPKELLALLSAVLPTRPSEWPFGIDEVLSVLGAGDSPVREDPMLSGLRRRQAQS